MNAPLILSILLGSALSMVIGVMLINSKKPHIQIISTILFCGGFVSLMVTSMICLVVMEPSQEWQQFSDERNESCNECLQGYGWNVTAGDHWNMSPFMYECCPDCRMDVNM